MATQEKVLKFVEQKRSLRLKNLEIIIFFIRESNNSVLISSKRERFQLDSGYLPPLHSVLI